MEIFTIRATNIPVIYQPKSGRLSKKIVPMCICLNAYCDILETLVVVPLISYYAYYPKRIAKAKKMKPCL